MKNLEIFSCLVIGSGLNDYIKNLKYYEGFMINIQCVA